MSKGINNLLSSLGLSDDLREEVLEAWEAVKEENKQHAIQQVREEYREQYKKDRDAMVLAAESIVNETLEKEISEFNEDRQKLHEGKKALLKNLKKVKALKENHEGMVNQRVKVFETFVMDTLKEELSEFSKDRQKLEEGIAKERMKLVKEQMRSKKLAESKEKAFNMLVQDVLKEEISEFHTDRARFNESIQKMENLMVSQLTEELSEFQEDRKELQERRVELEKEFKQKLDEAKDTFIKRASKSAERLVNETLSNELHALKEDIQVAKQNTFGRKLFEAFASEFYYSHMSENTEISKIMKKLDESQKNAEKLQKIVKEQAQAINKTRQELNETRESSMRQSKIDKLVRPLAPTQRKIMSKLLEGVEAQKLDEAFERYLPNVLERNSRTTKAASSEANGRKKLSESKGNREQRKPVFENANRDKSEIAGNEYTDEITRIISQAGIKTKK